MKLRLSYLLLPLALALDAAAAPLESIEALRLKGDYAGALDLARVELEIDARNPRLLNLAGEIELEQGRLDSAEAFFRDAVAVDGLDLLMAQRNLARVHLERGERDAAAALYDEISAQYQDGFGLDARDLLAVAEATAYRGNSDPQLFKQAVRIYDQAIRRDPAYLDAGIALGELLLEKYNNEEAQQAFQQVLEKDDEHPRALLGLARSQHFDYSSEAAATALQALTFNRSLVAARVFLARVFIELEQYADARHEVGLALEVNPRSLQALTLLAAIHLLERDREAFDEIEGRVLELNPDYADFYTLLAEVSVQIRLYRDAAEFARKALELDQRSWRAHGLLGMNLLRLGRIEAGRASLERSFAGDPYNVWIKNTLQLADTFENYVESVRDRFVIVLHGDEDALLREYVNDLAVEAYADFSQRYRHEPAAPIRVEFYPDHADFSVRTVGLAGVGLLGVAFGPVVAMDSPAARSRGAFNWGSTLWHELAHVFHLSMTDNRVPRWFTEGLSVYEERRARPGWGADPDPGFLRAYLDGRLLPVSGLNNGFVRPTYPEQVIHSYYQASLVLEFIESRWGFGVIRDILADYRSSRDQEATLLRHLDTDADLLDAEFDGYLRSRFASALAALDDDGDAPQLDLDNPPRETEIPQSYAVQMRFGTRLLEQGKPELAEAFLRRAQQLFPEYAGDDSSYWLLAELYLQQEKRELAERELERLVAINGENYAAQRRLAELRARRGDPAGAADALEAAIYIYPYDPDLHLELAQHAASLDDWPRAARERRALLALDPVDRAEAHYQLARAYQRGGDRSSAREQILYALEIAPNYTEAQELLLSLHAAQAIDD